MMDRLQDRVYLNHWTGKAGLCHGTGMAEEKTSTVDICMEALNDAIADLQR
jgi:hypothetical protein